MSGPTRHRGRWTQDDRCRSRGSTAGPTPRLVSRPEARLQRSGAISILAASGVPGPAANIRSCRDHSRKPHQASPVNWSAARGIGLYRLARWRGYLGRAGVQHARYCARAPPPPPAGRPDGRPARVATRPAPLAGWYPYITTVHSDGELTVAGWPVRSPRGLTLGRRPWRRAIMPSLGTPPKPDHPDPPEVTTERKEHAASATWAGSTREAPDQWLETTERQGGLPVNRSDWRPRQLIWPTAAAAAGGSGTGFGWITDDPLACGCPGIRRPCRSALTDRPGAGRNVSWDPDLGGMCLRGPGAVLDDCGLPGDLRGRDGRCCYARTASSWPSARTAPSWPGRRASGPWCAGRGPCSRRPTGTTGCSTLPAPRWRSSASTGRPKRAGRAGRRATPCGAR